MSVQVLQEFYAQTTRASRKNPLPHELAEALVESWTRFQIQDMALPILRTALRIRRAQRISFWDSTIVAAALSLRCDSLYSEDLNHGQTIDGLTVVNPFRS